MWRILLLSCSSLSALATPTLCQSTASPAVLVELFTSEGCSSCPPADAWLAKIPKQFDPQKVVTLAWHVDYWDYLGWKDALAQAPFSARQRERVTASGSGNMYTPQLMVNGQTRFWHDQPEALIQQQLVNTQASTLQFNAQRQKPNEWLLHITAPALPANTRLRAALLGETVSRKIGTGENAGRTLLHPSPVLAFDAHVNGNVLLNSQNHNAIRAVVWLERLNQSEVLAVSSLNLSECSSQKN
jgi:hypothetical protein